MIYELKNCSDINRKPLTYEIDEDTGCWECGSHYTNKGGYPKCWYSGTSMRVHRAIFISHFNIANLPARWVVRHTCDNRSCINPKHLLIGTNTDNTRDMVERNRQAKGSKNGQSRLTEKQVLEIKSNHIDNGVVLGKKYGVTKCAISDIRLGKGWGWLNKYIGL